MAHIESKTAAERQAMARQRRKEELEAMRTALHRIARSSTDACARRLALDALLTQRVLHATDQEQSAD